MEPQWGAVQGRAAADIEWEATCTEVCISTTSSLVPRPSELISVGALNNSDGMGTGLHHLMYQSKRNRDLPSGEEEHSKLSPLNTVHYFTSIIIVVTFENGRMQLASTCTHTLMHADTRTHTVKGVHLALPHVLCSCAARVHLYTTHHSQVQEGYIKHNTTSPSKM